MYVCIRIWIYVFFYRTCRFSQLFDLLMSLRQIFCKISLAKFSDMCVRELRIFIAPWAAAFLSRVSFKRIYVCMHMIGCVFFFKFDSISSTNTSSIINSSDGRSGEIKTREEKKRKEISEMMNLHGTPFNDMRLLLVLYLFLAARKFFSSFTYMLLITQKKRCVYVCAYNVLDT